MKNTDTENRNRVVSAAVWSSALMLALALGMMLLFPAASRRNGTNPEPAETSASVRKQAETQSVPAEPDRKLPSSVTAEPVVTEAADNAAETVPAVSDEAPAWEITPEAAEDPVTPVSVYPAGDAFSCIMPVNGTVTQDFTENTAVYSLTMNDYRVHDGIDIYAPVGTRVMACAAGTVERVWDDPFLGSCVQINHGGDLKSVYCNLSPDRPKGMEAGATVLAGDVIGGVGETMTVEMAESDHLHFCMTEHGVFVNPLNYIPNTRNGVVPTEE